MYYFNFSELQEVTEDHIPSIFVLAVGTILVYNNYIINNLLDFRYKCFPLLDIPYILSKRKLVRVNYYKQIEILYRTKEPQSYITDGKFLFTGCSMLEKVQYLKLLSYRSIKNTNSWINLDIVEDKNKIVNNKLLTITQDKIYFNYEGTNNK
jgi:hypothetical protein